MNQTRSGHFNCVSLIDNKDNYGSKMTTLAEEHVEAYLRWILMKQDFLDRRALFISVLRTKN